MHYFKRLSRCACLAVLVSTSAYIPYATAQVRPSQPATLEFRFDYELAKIVSNAVVAGELDDKTATAVRALPATAAMVRKMKLKDTDEFLAYLRTLVKNPKVADAARLVASELSRTTGGKYETLGTDVTRQLREYVPPQFAARMTVHFIFGGYSGGFAFDDDPNNVYVNLAYLAQGSTQELSEIVAHELFHAVQAHEMSKPPRPAAGAGAAAAGHVWLNRLLYDLIQEGTAQLFIHPVASRPATSAYSTGARNRIERNTKRIEGIATLFETIGFRLLLAPPHDETAYDRIYGLMFYTGFDEQAYYLGWVMATAIEQKEGKAAIFALLKDSPKRFILRYQTLAQADQKLPKFSDEFIRAVSTLP